MVRPFSTSKTLLMRVLAGYALASVAACSGASTSGGGGFDPNDPRHQNDHQPPTANSDPTMAGAVATGPGGNGMAAPPPPSRVDTGGNMVADNGGSAETDACARSNDRPFGVYDVPGADSMLLVDDKVTLRSTLRTPDNT